MRSLLKQFHKSTQQRKTRNRRSRRMTFESLESRTLMAGDFALSDLTETHLLDSHPQPSCSIALEGDQILVAGTTGIDALSFEIVPLSLIGVRLDCGDTQMASGEFKASQVREIVFDGRGAQDFILNFTPIPVVKVGDKVPEKPNSCLVQLQDGQVRTTGTEQNDVLSVEIVDLTLVGVRLDCGDAGSDEGLFEFLNVQEIIFDGQGGNDLVQNGTSIPVIKIGDEEPDEPDPTEPEPDSCQLDLDIHRPQAQVLTGEQSLIDEEQDHKVGAYTIRNDDIDAHGQLLLDRISNVTKLSRIRARNDAEFRGAITEEDDLVRIDLHNPLMLDNVYLVAYEMTQRRVNKVRAVRTPQRPLRTNDELTFWESADRAGSPVVLPFKMTEKTKTLYVEGLVEGRYRLVLMASPNENPRNIRAFESDPHGTSGEVSLTPEPACWDHVKTTVAAVDIFQTGSLSRKEVYDVFEGGRALFSANLWPSGGNFTWDTDGTNAAWINGKLRDKDVLESGATSGGSVEDISTINGGMAHEIAQVGEAVSGTDLYAAGVVVNYEVEGVALRRSEPLTILAPDHITIHSTNIRGFDQLDLGGRTNVSRRIIYNVLDQHDRRLNLRGSTMTVANRYGATLNAYEALYSTRAGLACEIDDDVHLTRQGLQQVVLKTTQRSRAIDVRNGRFSDNFFFRLDERAMNNAGVGNDETLLQIGQDIVIQLDTQTEAGEIFDVLVARDNVIEFYGRTGNRNRQFAFRLTLGGNSGRELNTGDPQRVPEDYKLNVDRCRGPN